MKNNLRTLTIQDRELNELKGWFVCLTKTTASIYGLEMDVPLKDTNLLKERTKNQAPYLLSASFSVEEEYIVDEPNCSLSDETLHYWNKKLIFHPEADEKIYYLLFTDENEDRIFFSKDFTVLTCLQHETLMEDHYEYVTLACIGRDVPVMLAGNTICVSPF